MLEKFEETPLSWYVLWILWFCRNYGFSWLPLNLVSFWLTWLSVLQNQLTIDLTGSKILIVAKLECQSHEIFRLLARDILQRSEHFPIIVCNKLLQFAVFHSCCPILLYFGAFCVLVDDWLLSSIEQMPILQFIIFNWCSLNDLRGLSYNSSIYSFGVGLQHLSIFLMDTIDLFFLLLVDFSPFLQQSLESNDWHPFFNRDVLNKLI